MIPTSSILSAELKFRQILEDFFISVYDEKSLPSHGISHHRRVWNYVKELLSLPVFCRATDNNLAENLILTSYLHDIGMSVEKGLIHGRHSRNFCVEFLTMYDLNPEDYIDVLDTIENHDRKDYLIQSPDNPLLTILSLADDLDAFGYTGIYRYVEIYLERSIKPEIIGYRIRENARVRFKNFEKIVSANNKFLQKHKIRFKILDDFFSEYNMQAETYNFGERHASGYCGVIELLKQSIDNKEDLKVYSMIPENYPEDKVIGLFFKGLLSELAD